MSRARSEPPASRESRAAGHRTGHAAWRVARGQEALGVLSAFTSPLAVAPGADLRIVAATRDPGTRVVAQVFRLGGGADGELLLYTSQRLLVPLGISDDCEALHRIAIPDSWRPGAYAARLTTEEGRALLLPFWVVSPRPSARELVLVSSMSHVARNRWGGGGLGRAGVLGALRGLVGGRASFARPWSDPRGGDALREASFLRWAEGLGLRPDLLTDIDVHRRPSRLADYERIILPGGAAFMSAELLAALGEALGRGADVLVLGAEVARHGLRLREARGEVWLERLPPWEQRRFGERARAVFPFISGGHAERPGALRFLEGAGELLAGTGLAGGSQVAGLAGGELGRAAEGAPGLTVLAEATVETRRGPAHGQTVLQRLSGGGTIFLAGTSRWLAALDPLLPAAGLQPDGRVQALTARLLGLPGACAPARAPGTAGEARRVEALASREPVIASLASVAGREASLREVVAALLPQVDLLRVYLNRYPAVPGFLRHPRIEVRRSQEHGDRGDAGKFFWADDHAPGYRLTCDDDLLYPPDYAERMLAAVERHGRRALVGVHGVLLKQPLGGYYDPRCRGVLRFPVALERDRAVHVLGTGTLAYHTSCLPLSRRDFQVPNMADVWLALAADAARVPRVAVARADGWLRQSPHAETEGDSIYRHSAGGDGTATDTGALQTHALRSGAPLSLQAPPGRRKLVLGVTTLDRRDYLQACLESFLSTRNPEHEWVVVVADDGSQDDTLAYLDGLPVAHELHVIRNRRRYAVGQTNSIFELCRRVGFDVGFKVDDDLVFQRPGWDDLYLEAIARSGFQHLCHLNHEHFLELRRRKDPGFRMPAERLDPSGACAAHVDVSRCMGAFFTFTPEVLERVGDADEQNFPIRGQWHIDYSTRCCRAGFNTAADFYDARGSNRFLALQNSLRGDYRCSIPWNEEYQRTKAPEELARRQRVIADAARVKIEPPRPGPARPRRVETFFDRIWVLNLDRRPDRLAGVQAQLDRLGIPFTRFPAVDGGLEPHRSAWEAYAREPLVEAPPGLRPVTSSREYYLDYEDQLPRVAFIEQRVGHKAIRSRGALGYLRSMERLLAQAIAEELEAVLVLDDDVLLHRDFHDLFARVVAELPPRWRILQLGTLQYHWDDGWVRFRSEHLYQCGGSSTASHAVGMHRSCFPMLLDLCRRALLPYDEGPLHQVKHDFPEECLTCFPNLVIQDTRESDIGSSETQAAEGRKAHNVYRWRLEDYLGG